MKTQNLFFGSFKITIMAFDYNFKINRGHYSNSQRALNITPFIQNYDHYFEIVIFDDNYIHTQIITETPLSITMTKIYV